MAVYVLKLSVREHITKAIFLNACQCPTWGRLDLLSEPEPMTPAMEWQFWMGNEIGRRARAFLGAGELLQTAPVGLAARLSRGAVQDAESTNLFEVTLQSGAFVARADGLRRHQDGWELIEVKSSKSPEDGKVRRDHIEDIAYTLFVARLTRLTVHKCSLVLLNRDHTAAAIGDKSAPNAGDMFVEVDVTDAASRLADVFAARADEISGALLGANAPAPELIYACRSCPHFADKCIGREIPDPVFDIPKLSEKAFEKIRGYERISRIPPDTTFTPSQQRYIDTVWSGAPWLGKQGLAALDRVVWPAYYLDFEGIAPAVPWFEGQKPYDLSPFQYSIHVRSGPGAETTHFEYLADPGLDWRRDLVEALLRDLGLSGSIVVYSAYERTQLGAMARMFPDLSAEIEACIARLFDLEPLFRHGYVHPRFRGRTSIKVVLPVLTGQTYEDLAIADGLNAAAVFGLMRIGSYAAESHAEHRANLLHYCALDTWAMVRLHEEVLRVSG